MKLNSFQIGFSLGAIFIAMFFAIVSAEELPGRRLISVNGSAELKIDPEQVTFSLGIKTFNKNSDIAKAELDSITTKIIRAANRFGVKSENIKTGIIQILPLYDEPWRNKGFKGFNVQKDMTIVLEDIGRYDSLLNELIMPEKIYIYYVNFGLKKPAEYRNRARLMAVEAAQEKARDMCTKLGCTLGKPYQVSDESNDMNYNYRNWSNPPAPNPFNLSVSAPTQNSDDLSGMAMGKISISAKVSISFDID